MKQRTMIESYILITTLCDESFLPVKCKQANEARVNRLSVDERQSLETKSRSWSINLVRQGERKLDQGGRQYSHSRDSRWGGTPENKQSRQLGEKPPLKTLTPAKRRPIFDQATRAGLSNGHKSWKIQKDTRVWRRSRWFFCCRSFARSRYKTHSIPSKAAISDCKCLLHSTTVLTWVLLPPANGSPRSRLAMHSRQVSRPASRLIAADACATRCNVDAGHWTLKGS